MCIDGRGSMFISSKFGNVRSVGRGVSARSVVGRESMYDLYIGTRTIRHGRCGRGLDARARDRLSEQWVPFGDQSSGNYRKIFPTGKVPCWWRRYGGLGVGRGRGIPGRADAVWPAQAGARAWGEARRRRCTRLRRIARRCSIAAVFASAKRFRRRSSRHRRLGMYGMMDCAASASLSCR